VGLKTVASTLTSLYTVCKQQGINMTLPRTPQEFTQFALEQGGYDERFYLRTIRRQTQYSKQQVRAWIKQSVNQAPEVFGIEHVQDGYVEFTTVRMAGVAVMLIQGHWRLESILEAIG
jgi:hypothetical protein